MLLQIMATKRKQPINEIDAERGRVIAEWLNRKHSDRPNSLIAALIGYYVLASDEAARSGKSVEEGMFSAFAIGKMLSAEQQSESASNFERLKAALRKSFNAPVRMQAEFRLRGPRIGFSLLPEDMSSGALSCFGQLLNSGNASRLRRCPNCRKFWYCEGRADKKACSPNCKVALWQKSPQGRAAKADYMRRHRAGLRERERKQRLTGTRLKASKSILAKLGK